MCFIYSRRRCLPFSLKKKKKKIVLKGKSNIFNPAHTEKVEDLSSF